MLGTEAHNTERFYSLDLSPWYTRWKWSQAKGLWLSVHSGKTNNSSLTSWHTVIYPCIPSQASLQGGGGVVGVMFEEKNCVKAWKPQFENTDNHEGGGVIWWYKGGGIQLACDSCTVPKNLVKIGFLSVKQGTKKYRASWKKWESQSAVFLSNRSVTQGINQGTNRNPLVLSPVGTLHLHGNGQN